MDELVFPPRHVALGDPGDIAVSRLLPQRAPSLVGGWCFLDHYGPTDAAMRVAPHPHTGLQTVSWLFSGEVEHRDALGTRELVRPGEVNLMTAGAGINHSEYSQPAGGPLHGVQLWTALPDAHRFTRPLFEHHVPEPGEADGHVWRVFVGELGGAASPVTVFSPMVGAEIAFGSDAPTRVPLRPAWEYAVLADGGTVRVDDVPVGAGHLIYLPPGRRGLALRAEPGAGVRAIVIGGEPLGESIIMWWNLIGRTHEEIEAWRGNWQAALGREEGADPGQFGPLVPRTDDEPEIPAPALPAGRLRPRG